MIGIVQKQNIIDTVMNLSSFKYETTIKSLSLFSQYIYNKEHLSHRM